MTRLSDPTDPSTSPLGRFAWDLRALRDSMGAGAPSVDEISAREGIPRSTLYAALRGRRLPRREVVAAFARSWGGDEAELLSKRSALEQQLSASVDLRSIESGKGYVSPARLSAESIDLLRESGVVEKHRSGTALYVQGDSCRDVLLIERGIVKSIASMPTGRSIVLNLRATGEILGEQVVLNDENHRSSAIAATDVAVRRIRGGQFIDLIKKETRIAFDLAKVLSERLRISDDRRIKSGLRAEERVIAILQNLSDDYGLVGNDGVIVIPRLLANQEIADMVGVSRSTVARCIDQLEKEGILEVGAKSWLLHGKLEDGVNLALVRHHEQIAESREIDPDETVPAEEDLLLKVANAWQYLQAWGISSLEDVQNAIGVIDECQKSYSNPAFVKLSRPLAESPLNRLEMVLFAPHLRPSAGWNEGSVHSGALKNFVESGARVTRDTILKIREKVPSVGRPAGRAATKNNQAEFRAFYDALLIVGKQSPDLLAQVVPFSRR